jgi:hypothetical protein
MKASRSVGLASATFVALASLLGAANAAPESNLGVAAVKVSTADTASATQVATAASAEASSGCARKVKVVYAGYGEAARAECPARSTTTAIR